MTSPYGSLAAAKAAFPNTSYVDLPAGDNSGAIGANWLISPDTTYFFEAGVHTLGGGEFSQIIPAKNDSFVGAPGAILDGQNQNAYAFTQHATGVTIVNTAFFVVPGHFGVMESAHILIVRSLGFTAALGLSVGVIRRIRKLATIAVALFVFVLSKERD